jgi:hypothetical protein
LQQCRPFLFSGLRPICAVGDRILNPQSRKAIRVRGQIRHKPSLEAS